MKIALVATSYPADRDDPSGHFVRAEALSLAERGHEVHVIAPAPYRGDRQITAHAAGGSSLFAWPGALERAQAFPLRLACAPLFGYGVRRALSRLHPDSVIAHWLVPCAYPLSLGCTRGELSVVCHGADVRMLLALPASVRVHIVRAVIQNGSQIRLVSNDLRSRLLSSLPADLSLLVESQSFVQPPSVDVRDAPPAASLARPYAVCASRLIEGKRTALGVQAILCSASPLDLVVIGDGPLLGTLRAASSSRLHFLGRRGRNETLGWLRGASLLLHTSAIDAAPTNVLEARALGVPVVSCGAGDVARWAETDDGIRLALPSAADLARAIDELVQETRGAKARVSSPG